jgi:hypothetical protein
MKSADRVLGRLRKDRPMVTITLRMPGDVVDDLKRVAPKLGFSGYQPLLRAYVGRGLRADLARSGAGSRGRRVLHAIGQNAAGRFLAGLSV